jgi:tetratricopeptide (TPR) repeat protein
MLFALSAVWGQAPKQNWKDRAEYDLYEAASKATDNAKKIELLNTWKQKYPSSDFSMMRLQLLLEAYNATANVEKVMETGNEILAAEPKNLRALYIMTLNTIRITKPTPELLASGEKAANGLVSNIDELFAADKKPASTPEADWTKARTDTLALGQLTLGWVAMQRKQNETAEKYFTACLQTNPANGQVSYWLATVILAEKNPDKNSAAIFQFARAAYLTGQGALPDQTRKEVAAYVTKLYTSYHGSADGLDEIRKIAESQAFPPPDFKVLSKAEIDLQKEEEFRKANPMLALWQTVKSELTKPSGSTYFDSSVKGALLPGGVNGITKFKGKLVAAKPPKNPKELVLSIGDSETGEITLVMEEPLVGSAPVGTDLEFEGIPSAFTASPYMLTFDVENDKLVGWPAPSPPAKKGAGAKKAAPAK